LNSPDFYSLVNGDDSESGVPDFYSIIEKKPTKIEKTRDFLKKARKKVAQPFIGAAETAVLPYELASLPTRSKKTQLPSYRQNLFEDIEGLLEKKSFGNWTPDDENLLKNLMTQAENPEESMQFLNDEPSGIGSLIEKGAEQFGVDLKPESLDEEALRVAGNLLNPKSLVKGIQNAPKYFTKGAKEARQWQRLSSSVEKNPFLRSILEFAKENNLTPKEATLLMQSEGKINAFGKISKKTKDFNQTTRSLYEKLGNKYETLKELGKNRGYLNTKEVEPLIDDLMNIVFKVEDPLGAGPETQKAIKTVTDTLENINNNRFTVANLINKRQQLKQGKLGIRWSEVDQGDTIRKQLDESLFNAIKRVDPKTAKELKKNDYAYSQYKKFKKLLDKKQPLFTFKGVPVHDLGSSLLFATGVGALSSNPATALKAVAIKEGVQRLSTKLLLDPNYQGLRKRLMDAVLEGSTKNQKGIITSILKVLKKDDPELYEDFENLD